MLNAIYSSSFKFKSGNISVQLHNYKIGQLQSFGGSCCAINSYIQSGHFHLHFTHVVLNSNSKVDLISEPYGQRE